MSEFSFKLAQADLAEWSELESCCFEQAWSSTLLAQMLARGHCDCIGVRREGVLIAVAIVSSILDEAELLRIAVAQSAQGQGVARRLLDTCEVRLRDAGVQRWMLEVAADNQVAIDLYRKAGFQLDGTRKGYYPTANGAIDALLMSKALSAYGV